jgi:hypothetical protein
MVEEWEQFRTVCRSHIQSKASTTSKAFSTVMEKELRCFRRKVTRVFFSFDNKNREAWISHRYFTPVILEFLPSFPSLHLLSQTH